MPGRAVILTAWGIGVVLLLGAIAHVAEEQVRKGQSLHGQNRADPNVSAVYADYAGSDAKLKRNVHPGEDFSRTSYSPNRQ